MLWSALRSNNKICRVDGRQVTNIGESYMYGWLAAKNVNIDCLGDAENLGECVQYNCLLNKFPEDRVLCDGNAQICFLDGYVHNKNDFISDSSQSWPDAFSDAVSKDLKQSLSKLRGGFCGYVYDKNTDIVTAYVDQVSVRALYYYADGARWIISNHLAYMVKVLQSNKLAYDFNPLAARYMLTYGYMIDDSTFIKQIHRVLPGNFVRLERGTVERVRYYFINNKEIRMTEEEAVERIDAAFRQAVAREFDKDREYGYRHLVDLSGGLDSRMVSWVAHDMGYTDQVNITYCQNGYRDEKISKEIAESLRHEYIFKSLDDAQWMFDIDRIISENNGAALCTGITGGERMLNTLNSDMFGIEHTGMIGDAILSTFYHDKEFNYSKPRFGLHMHSERLKYEWNSAVLEEYPCQEMFAVYTRGILGAQSSYMIRQHYVETASPFMDVDFLDTVFSVPFEYRNRHHIYLKWMIEKYPGSTEFGWEKWGGIKPKESHIFFRKIKTTERLLWMGFCKIFKIVNKDIMTPLDLWYRNDKELKAFWTKYYNDNIKISVLDKELVKDIVFLYEKGDATEKSMALTVLAMAKKYFL